jgi:hypothetical protein
MQIALMTDEHSARRLARILGKGVFLLALAGIGCGPKVGHVSGRVLFKNEPLSSGTVTFVAADGKRKSCVIAPDQTYTLGSFPIGLVKIGFASHSRVPSGLQQDQSPVPAIPQIPVKYKNPEESGLNYVVKAGNQFFDIDLNP